MAKEKSEEKQKNVILEYAQLVISVVVIVFVVRSFVFEPFRIPSESMDPTLKTGDYVIVTKFSYGFGRQSIFDIPLIDDRLFWREPKRGNVVVFADPSDPRRTKLIKRVVGVPGDTIEVRNSLLYINGEAADRVNIGPGESNADLDRLGFFYEEPFPSQNGEPHSHMIWDKVEAAFFDNVGPYTVPEDHLFFMGDNRDSSKDSRAGSLGPVHRTYLMGRAQFVLFSLNIEQKMDPRYPNNTSRATNQWNIVNPFRWGRFLKGIR